MIKENGDFETIILADPPDKDPELLMELLCEEIEKYLGSDDRINLQDCPSITIDYIKEENEERTFIEMIIGSSKIIIRDLSSQCYQKNFNPSQPFNVRGESSSFRSKFLTDQLLFSKFRLPQNEKDFPQDIYPFLVRCFFRIIKTDRLLNFANLSILQRIQEERLLWNEFLMFFLSLDNLFRALYEAQKSLRGFGDCDCIQKDQAGNYSINEYSDYVDTCKKLVVTLYQQVVPEDLEENEDYAPDYDFFLQEALL